MTGERDGRARRFVSAFGAYYAVALGLGYAGLNRFDARTVAGLSDARAYFAMVAREPGDAIAEPFRYRLLLPALAAGVRALVGRGHLGSASPEAFSMLVVSAAFVAGTAMVVARLAREIDPRPAIGPLAAFVHLAAFAVVHLQLAGLVDAGETFFVLAAVCAARAPARLGLGILIAASVLAKETTPAFCLVGAWAVRSASLDTSSSVALRATRSWDLALGAALAVATHLVTRTLVGPAREHAPSRLARALEDPGALVVGLFHGLASSTTVLTFGALAMLAPSGLRRLPRPLAHASLATGALAIVLATLGDVGPNVSRVLFSVVGPTLAIAAALGLAGAEPQAGPARDA